MKICKQIGNFSLPLDCLIEFFRVSQIVSRTAIQLSWIYNKYFAALLFVYHSN